MTKSVYRRTIYNVFYLLSENKASIFVTRHEKTGLMCTKYTPLYYSTLLEFFVSYFNSINCIIFSIVYCTSCKSFMDKVCLNAKL